MTRINLLPPERVKVKKIKPSAAKGERSYWWMLLVFPLIVAGILGFWYFSLNSKVNEKNKALEAAKAELQDWQSKNQQLQQYKARQDEVLQLTSSIAGALSGRIYWARILNEIAIMCPKDVWLTSLSGGEDGVEFSCVALQCKNRYHKGHYIWYPDYRPVANWLDRMAQIIEFSRVWLGAATPVRTGTSGDVTPEGEMAGPWTITFSSKATLNLETAALGPKLTGGTTPPPAPSTAPSSSTPSSSGTGGAVK